jgi:hypothetical protein
MVAFALTTTSSSSTAKMPSASVLAATNLAPLRARTISSSQSAFVNDDFCEIYVNTATPVPAAEIQAFRSYLATIPFDFHDCRQYTMPGHMLDSEGDVRLFLESAAVLPCWPVALSMVPAARQFDLHIRSERSLDHGNRPDISVMYTLNGAPIFHPFLAIQFKGPGVLSFCRNGIPTNDCDDWVDVTTQLRKFACINGFSHAVVMDGCHALYFHFTDPNDEDATVRYMMASVSGGPVGFSDVVTARELLLFSFFMSLARITPARLVPFSRNMLAKISNCFAASGIILPSPFLQAVSLTMRKSTRPRASHLPQRLHRVPAVCSGVPSNCRCARLHRASRGVRSLLLILHP